MTSYAHDVFLSKVIINIQCVYRPTGMHIYKTQHHFRTGFILILDPENTGLDNFKSKLS